MNFSPVMTGIPTTPSLPMATTSTKSPALVVGSMETLAVFGKQT